MPPIFELSFYGGDMNDVNILEYAYSKVIINVQVAYTSVWLHAYIGLM